MTGLAERVLKSTVVHVGFAFLAMGGWAFLANAGHPVQERLLAGVVQGAMSALLTLFLKRSVDWMRPRFPHGAGYWAPALIASLASATLLVCIHLAAGTPEILATVAVPLTVSVTYIFTYNILRQRSTGET